jgi:hypothetical protein
MGVAVGDYDDNGYMDLYLANTPEPPPAGLLNVMLRNNGDGTFDNVATQAGTFGGRLSWGVAFLDYDNDGRLDLSVVNWDIAGDIGAKNQFFRNNGDGTFTDIADQVGAGDDNPGYGLCVGDFDDDGYTDMFVSNNMAPSVLYRNTGGPNRWLKVRVVGSESNRDGIGARVRVVTGLQDQIFDIDGGTSYLAHNLKEARFGVGALFTVDTLEVRWPSGWVDKFPEVATSQTVTVIEGMTEPVEVSMVAAVVTADGVHVSWDVNRDVIVQSFRVYRDDLLLNTDTPIDKSVRDYTDASDLAPDTEYEYVVAAVLDGGVEVRSDPVAARTPPPALGLEQNYPNPFNPGTTISFVLPRAERARLSIFDAAGRLVEVLVDADLEPGPHDRTWGGHTVASGVYFCRLETASGVLTRKMVHVK